MSCPKNISIANCLSSSVVPFLAQKKLDKVIKKFVSEYFADIHDENFCFDEYGNVVIFDYAWNGIE